MNPQQSISRRTVLKTVGVGVTGGIALTGSATAHRGGLQRELAEVRSATASYNNPSNAESDGYHLEAEAVCGMGYHAVNFSLVFDGTVSKPSPEGLAYGEAGDGNLILGAVEYIVPKAGAYATDPPADLFDNADPEWHILEVPPEAPLPVTELWTLHAWVHSNNPEGVFNPTNPRKQFSPDGCVNH